MPNLQIQPENPIQQWHVQIAAHGRLNIPASLRKAAHIKDGDEFILTLKADQTIQIESRINALRELQALVAEHCGGVDFQAELKAMRAVDIAREAEKLQKRDKP